MINLLKIEADRNHYFIQIAPLFTSFNNLATAPPKLAVPIYSAYLFNFYQVSWLTRT